MLPIPKPLLGLGFGWYYVQWVDHYFWQLALYSRDSKEKLEVKGLGQVVQNKFQKMNMKK
jgi:hypothetical protein